jgi:hypothetical protein
MYERPGQTKNSDSYAGATGALGSDAGSRLGAIAPREEGRQGVDISAKPDSSTTCQTVGNAASGVAVGLRAVHDAHLARRQPRLMRRGAQTRDGLPAASKDGSTAARRVSLGYRYLPMSPALEFAERVKRDSYFHPSVLVVKSM